MHSRPLRAHTAPRVATSSQPRPTPSRAERSRAGAAAAAAVAAAGPSASLLGPLLGRAGGRAVWQGTEHRNASFSNKKEKSSLYTVVCFGSVQTE